MAINLITTPNKLKTYFLCGKILGLSLKLSLSANHEYLASIQVVEIMLNYAC